MFDISRVDLSGPVFRDGLGERLTGVERGTGAALELLRVRPELAAVESALGDRIERLKTFSDPRFTPLRGVASDPETGRPLVVSKQADGERLSIVLERATARHVVPDITVALHVVVRTLEALATLDRNLKTAHGALGLERLFVTRRGHIVIADYAFAPILPSLGLSPTALWRELRLAVPSTGLDKGPFGPQIDIAQAAMMLIALTVGRPLVDEEWYGRRLPALVAEVRDIASIRSGDRMAEAVGGWLDATLISTQKKARFKTAAEARFGLERALPKDAGVIGSREDLESLLEQIDQSDDFAASEPAAVEAVEPLAVEIARPAAEVVEPIAQPVAEPVAEPEPIAAQAAEPIAATEAEPVAAATSQLESVDDGFQLVEIDGFEPVEMDEPEPVEIAQPAPVEIAQTAPAEIAVFVAAEIAEPAAVEDLAPVAASPAEPILWAEAVELVAAPAVEFVAAPAVESIATPAVEPALSAVRSFSSALRSLWPGRRQSPSDDRAPVAPAVSEQVAAEIVPPLEEPAVEPAPIAALAVELIAVEEATPVAAEVVESPPVEIAEPAPIESAELAPIEIAQPAAQEIAEPIAIETVEPVALETVEPVAPIELAAPVAATEIAPIEIALIEIAPIEIPAPVPEPIVEPIAVEEPEPIAAEVSAPAPVAIIEPVAVAAAPVEPAPIVAQEPEPIPLPPEPIAAQPWEFAPLEIVWPEPVELAQPAGIEIPEATALGNLEPAAADIVGPVENLADEIERAAVFTRPQELPLPPPASAPEPPAPARPISPPVTERQAWDETAQIPLRPMGPSGVSHHDDPIARALKDAEDVATPWALPQAKSRGTDDMWPIEASAQAPVVAARARTRVARPRPSIRRILAAVAGVLIVAGASAAGVQWLSARSQPGFVVVESTPAGSEVLVDKQPSGKTPVVLTLNPGPHVLELKRGTRTRTFTLAIEPGSRLSQRLDWSKAVDTGSLRVTSDPTDARVLVDGTLRGKTPLFLSSIAIGQHTVVVESSAGSVTNQLKVAANQAVTLNVPLSSGWLAVFSPVELKILERNRRIGTTNDGRLAAAPGRHELEFVNQELGYHSKAVMTVKPNETATLSLEPKGMASFSAVAGAEVFVDGEKIGVTPLVNVPVTIGTREVVFKHPSFGERRVIAVISMKETAQVSDTAK